jgi:hypothetical protein
MAQRQTEELQACIDLVADTLATEEAILVVERGQTKFAKQTFQYYRVQIGTFKMLTGNDPVNQRTVFVQVNVDPPHQSKFVDASDWLPLPHQGDRS